MLCIEADRFGLTKTKQTDQDRLTPYIAQTVKHELYSLPSDTWLSIPR